jgi:hypothetical protein
LPIDAVAANVKQVASDHHLLVVELWPNTQKLSDSVANDEVIGSFSGNIVAISSRRAAMLRQANTTSDK